jgi:hypothetical protein
LLTRRVLSFRYSLDNLSFNPNMSGVRQPKSFSEKLPWYVTCMFFIMSFPAPAQYTPHPHRLVEDFEIAVDGPGSYSKPGATYVLTRDVVSEKSAIFLGKDVTLDLNGYTVTFARGNYDHLPNSGFEKGLSHWDVSAAPGARVVNTRDVHIFIGEKLLSLEAGDELVSEMINLPVANRSYYAICGITGHHYRDMSGDLSGEMKISLFVEDASGNQVTCKTMYGDGEKVSCPVLEKSPRLGGGFIVAHLNQLPAGQYRIRVKADTPCLIDEIDIRPVFDVGIGIAGETHPFGHYDHLYDIVHSAFFDYTVEAKTGTPTPDIPLVQGRGTVTIKNGVIRNGTPGVMSWGIQSTAPEVKVILDNVHIINSGINATAVDVPQASIKHCTFEVDNPFLINRHGSQHYAVDLRGPEPSEVAFSEFLGGQGCLVFKGKFSSIHDNYLVNHQMVTNHYSIMAMGDSSLIFGNTIEPRTGSGIEIYVHRGIEIFNNHIAVTASPPTCEYGHEEYSVAAIRIADYQAEPGSERIAAGNKVYNNTIQVTGIDYPEFSSYKPMVWAVFYSASGGENDIFGNRILVDHRDPLSKAEAAAFYIGPGQKGYGGHFDDNLIHTNVPAAWIATMYGGTANTRITHNTIIRSPDTSDHFQPFRMGWDPCKTCIAKNVRFSSNEIEGAEFGIDITGQDHRYEVYWTLKIKTTDARGNPVRNLTLSIYDADDQLVFEGKTNALGEIQTELLDYIFEDGQKKISDSYRLKYAGKSGQITMDKNQFLVLEIN